MNHRLNRLKQINCVLNDESNDERNLIDIVKELKEQLINKEQELEHLQQKLRLDKEFYESLNSVRKCIYLSIYIINIFISKNYIEFKEMNEQSNTNYKNYQKNISILEEQKKQLKQEFNACFVEYNELQRTIDEKEKIISKLENQCKDYVNRLKEVETQLTDFEQKHSKVIITYINFFL